MNRMKRTRGTGSLKLRGAIRNMERAGIPRNRELLVIHRSVNT